MKGRLKKSSEDKYGHTPPVGKDFSVESALPEKPKGLSRLARREWDRIVELLMLKGGITKLCLLYTSPSPRDLSTSRMPSSA